MPAHPAPHYRGGFLTRIGGWLSTYIDSGSRRFLSTPSRSGTSFFAAALFVYGSDDLTRVFLVDADNQHGALWRVFIKSKFPFITRSSEGGGYKSLHFKFGFAKPQVMTLETAQDTFEICHIRPVADSNLLPDLAEINAELAQLENDKTSRDIAKLAHLERSLLALRSTGPDHDIDKALIHLYCLFRVNHRRAHKLLGLWSDNETERGEAEAAQAFQKHLLGVTSPLALGRHGYNPSFQNLDLDKVEAELHALMSDLEQLDVRPFLNSGTLLGYFRDGRPIPHDDDFDLGILVKGDTEDDAAKNWRRFVAAVSGKFNIIDKGSFVAMTLSDGVQVDLFPSWIIDTNVFVHPYCWADVTKDALLPMERINVRGRHFPIPANPDAVLTVNYGPNWRVPDPFWRFDYRKSEQRFRQALKKFKG